MTIEAGTKLGHYEIRSKIREVAMGGVYLAQDTKLARKVPLKILRSKHHKRIKQLRAASE